MNMMNTMNMMNMISMVLVALVAFTYFGGQNVPKFLKDYKHMVLSFSVGVLLQQFMDVGIEGAATGSAVSVVQNTKINAKEMIWNKPVGNLMLGSTTKHVCKGGGAEGGQETVSAPYTVSTGAPGKNNILHCSGSDDVPTSTHICPDDAQSFTGSPETGYICK